MIHRSDKTKGNFSRISNQILNDKRLTLEAKGLMAVLLSNADNWEIVMTEITSRSKSNENRTRRVSKELTALGYLEKKEVRRNGSSLKATKWNVSEEGAFTVPSNPGASKSGGPKIGTPKTGTPVAGTPNSDAPNAGTPIFGGPVLGAPETGGPETEGLIRTKEITNNEDKTKEIKPKEINIKVEKDQTNNGINFNQSDLNTPGQLSEVDQIQGSGSISEFLKPVKSEVEFKDIDLEKIEHGSKEYYSQPIEWQLKANSIRIKKEQEEKKKEQDEQDIRLFQEAEAWSKITGQTPERIFQLRKQGYRITQTDRMWSLITPEGKAEFTGFIDSMVAPNIKRDYPVQSKGVEYTQMNSGSSVPLVNTEKPIDLNRQIQEHLQELISTDGKSVSSVPLEEPVNPELDAWGDPLPF